MRNTLLTILALTLALTLATPAFATSVAWEWTGAGTEFTNDNWTFGAIFVPTGNLVVTDLGYFNQTGGMTDSHWVGLYDAGGNLLSSTTITSGSTALSTHFLFNAISPVTLTSGNTYVIDAVSGADKYSYNDNGFSTDPNVSWIGYNFLLNGGNSFTGTGGANSGINDGFWGGNFIYGGTGIITGTPEPASFLLFGTGILVAGLIRRKRA